MSSLDDAEQALAYLDRMLVTRHTDIDAGTLHYSTAEALRRAKPDKYVIERTGRQRTIRRVTRQAELSDQDRLVITWKLVRQIVTGTR